MILFVDPGKGFGWGVFKETRLTACGLAREDHFPAVWKRAEKLYVERPHAGQGRSSKKDLITLSSRMGLVKGWVGLPRNRMVEIEPSQWKGSAPKFATHALMIEQLSTEEIDVLGAALDGIAGGLQHNTLDAVSMGVLYLIKKNIRKRI